MNIEKFINQYLEKLKVWAGKKVKLPASKFLKGYEFMGQDVESSNIKTIEYDKENYILKVTFLNGSIYHYQNVTPEVYNSFIKAPSKGKFLHRKIKGRYDYYKV